MKISIPSRDRRDQGGQLPTAQNPDPVIANAISRLETEAPTHEPAAVNAGIWINQQKAVIVTMTDEGEDVQTVRAGGGGGAAPTSAMMPPSIEHATADEARFYEQVSSRIRNAETVLIFGPGKAKTRLKTHLKNSLSERSSVVIAPADRMTEEQITGQVRNYFKIMVPVLPLI